MRIKNMTLILILSSFCILINGCSGRILDKSLKAESFIVSESKVVKKQKVSHSQLTGIYLGIDDMYKDSDYVVSGVVKDIEYFQVQYVLLRKINVLVSNNYKGNIKKNTLISVLENDGYLTAEIII